MIQDIKNQKHIVGIKQSTRAIESSEVLEAFVAKDADCTVVSNFERLCALNQIPVTYIESKKTLGVACGIDVNASVAVILK